MIILTCVLAYLLVGFLFASFVIKSNYFYESDALIFIPLFLFWPWMIVTFVMINLVAPICNIINKYIKWLKSSKKNSAPAEGEW